MISGLVVIVLMLGFFSITFWAWSARKRADFEEAAQSPLRDESLPERRS